MKKLAVIISAAVLVLCCVSTIFATGGEERSYMAKGGEALYSVTYSGIWATNENAKDVPAGMRDALAEATGADIQLYGGEEKVSDREIFIGNTSLQLGSHKTRVGEGGIYKVDGEILRRDGFFISTAGERYILAAAYSDGAWNAAYYFMEKGLGYDLLDREKTGLDLSAPRELYHIHTQYLDCSFPVDLDIDGHEADEFTVVYPADASDRLKETAAKIRIMLFALTGKAAGLSDDSAEPRGPEICVGDTNRTDLSLGEKDMIIRSFDGGIVICGGNDFTTERAADAFAGKYLLVENGQYTGDSVLVIPGGLDYAEQSPFALASAEGTDYTMFTRDNIERLLGIADTPCFSGADVPEKIAEAVKSAGNWKGSEAFVICNRADWCGCEDCKGSTGAYFDALSKAADILAEDGIRLSTVAVNETRAPHTGSVSDNLRIYFLETGVCCAHALNDPACADNAAVADDLRAWTKICGDVVVIDVTMSYRRYPATFPDIGVIRPNISFYAECGANGVVMAWDEGMADLEFGRLRKALIEKMLADPGMSAEEYSRVYENALSSLYGDGAGAVGQYIEKFTAASSDHFGIFSRPSEILPIAKDETKSGAEAYDLGLAKELAGLWESVYYRHDPPVPAYSGLRNYALKKHYTESDYYVQLHSRVQLTEWIKGCIGDLDRYDVFMAIADSYS